MNRMSFKPSLLSILSSPFSLSPHYSVTRYVRLLRYWASLQPTFLSVPDGQSDSLRRDQGETGSSRDLETAERCSTTHKLRVFIWYTGFSPKGGQYVFVCKACGKLGGSRGMLPCEILILDRLLDAIWLNLGLFSHKHNDCCLHYKL